MEKIKLKRVYQPKTNETIFEKGEYSVKVSGLGKVARIKFYDKDGIYCENKYSYDGSNDKVVINSIKSFVSLLLDEEVEVEIVLPIYTEDELMEMLGHEFEIKGL